MATPIHISAHATERSKERLRWNSETLTRMARKALESGITHADTKGRLNRYLTKLFLTHGKGNNTRIYGEHVFVFEGSSLITVLHLPYNLRRAAQAQDTRRKTE